MVIRALVERFSRNRIIRRRMPADLGSREIYVSPDSALSFWKRDLSSVAPELFSLARRLVKPNDVVWDIGANVGLFAFAASARAGHLGKVLAIEPDPWLVTLLHRSGAWRNPDESKVQILNVAISDAIGIMELNIATRGRSSNFVSGFGSTQSGGSRTSFPVMTVTLDWLMGIFGVPTVVKIDIEGMDLVALRGADRLLELRPTLIMEGSKKNSDEVFALLTAKRYQLLQNDLRTAITADYAAHLPHDFVALPN